MRRRSIRAAAVVVAACLIVAGVAMTAHAATFYWNRIKVKTDTEPRCRDYAVTVMKRRLMSDVRSDSLAVWGHTSTSSATVTCFQFGPGKPAMAVIMVWGDADAPAHRLSADLKDSLEQMQSFNY